MLGTRHSLGPLVRQFILGALCGVAVTAAAAYLLPSGGGAVAVANADSSTRHEDRLTQVSPPPAQREPLPSAGSGMPPAPATGMRAAPPAQGTAAGRRPSTATSASTDAPLPPVQLSAEHAELLKPHPKEGQPPTLPELHMQFATEQPDPSWSLRMEQALQQYLAEGPYANEFEILNAECRATLCELTAFGNLPASGQHWGSLLAEMGNQPWWSNFRGHSTSHSEKNGRTTIVTILQRAKAL